MALYACKAPNERNTEMSLMTFYRGVLARRKPHPPTVDEARSDFDKLMRRDLSIALELKHPMY